ncbi:SusD/RagB family nutrient-binding outer membrane lipoprotein [Ohtaekwangia koreensis]|uniref:Susd and RagB outer membrane lipoprotein n=1 Tax=Ohtaekwangia koreensis TaxID=688867 RepID=A0A1T5JH46_9BACT|nr:SusD/RagB family nutrient-binding outer membrane lipoprotein [Ohtaekwangia koreensis]SKC50694.1 Susd and RagB outer membrane lipoprotein [Ohtaekwangia koreensis]
MKRGKIILLVVFFVVGLFNSCKDELDDRYLNPDRTTDASIDQFFTEMLNNNRVRPMYWEVSTFINWHIGIYTQSVGFLNSESVYQQNEAYITDRWNDFYRPSANGAGVVAQYREIEKAYAALSSDEQKSMEVFVQAAKVVLYEQTAQMVDLWGDIPFSEAGMLNKTGEVVYPKFDSDIEIYNTVLAGLEEAAMYFSSASLSNVTQALFAKQDILLSGDLRQWQRYANALRLRLLMRISFVDEARSMQEVQTMLNDPATYPLIGDADAQYLPDEDDVLLQPLTSYVDDLHLAFTDWTNYPAPYYMLEEVLKPVGDLRIPVLFDKYGQMLNGQFMANTEYSGMPVALSRTEQQLNLDKFAILDSATFLYNAKLPGVVMTSSEVDFLKAEAYERWGGGNAEEAYSSGVRKSIDFYYYLNTINQSSGKTLTPPSQEAKDNFIASKISAQYIGTQEEKLAKIWTQKWVHFGFLQSVQSWSELRRTNYPELDFYSSPLTGYELPPSRLTYPTNEKTFNNNYQAVAAKDTRNGIVFWDIN